MSNLEKKSTISPWQLSLIVIAAVFGPGIISGGRILAEIAGSHEWFVLLLGAVLYGSMALLMVKLGQSHPGCSLLEYMPLLWGRLLGNTINAVFVGLHVSYFILILATLCKIVSIFMFDRTPPEILGLTMIIVCTYCALQDFGTILRVLQLVVLTTVPVFVLIFSTGLLSVQPEHLLPLWPQDPGSLLAQFSNRALWGTYAGYEVLLLLLPLLYSRQTSPVTTVAAAFGCMGLINIVFALITIGVLSADNAKQLAYPAMEVARFVELPGTFLERLEIYLLGAWIPNVFTSLTIHLYVASYTLMKINGHADHRPWVLLLLPWILLISTFFTDMLNLFHTVLPLVQKVAWVFSGIVVPGSLALTWWRNRRMK